MTHEHISPKEKIEMFYNGYEMYVQDDAGRFVPVLYVPRDTLFTVDRTPWVQYGTDKRFSAGAIVLTVEPGAAPVEYSVCSTCAKMPVIPASRPRDGFSDLTVCESCAVYELWDEMDKITH